LLIWARRYRLGGFPALAPKARSDCGVSRVITPQLAELIERLKRENPHRTAATLLRELALSSGSATPPISPSSLHRFQHERGLTERELLNPATARKKFEADPQGWRNGRFPTPEGPSKGSDPKDKPNTRRTQRLTTHSQTPTVRSTSSAA
jgi:hypothetical protein